MVETMKTLSENLVVDEENGEEVKFTSMATVINRVNAAVSLVSYVF